MNRQSWLYISRPKHALSSLVWALTDIEIWSFAVPPQPSLNLHTLHQQLAKTLLKAQTPACYQLLLPVLSLFQINLHPPQKTVYHPSIWRQICPCTWQAGSIATRWAEPKSPVSSHDWFYQWLRTQLAEILPTRKTDYNSWCSQQSKCVVWYVCLTPHQPSSAMFA